MKNERGSLRMRNVAIEPILKLVNNLLGKILAFSGSAWMRFDGAATTNVAVIYCALTFEFCNLFIGRPFKCN